jgi:adenylate cyclase
VTAGVTERRTDLGDGADPRIVDRCVAFVDLCGSSAFLEHHGPRETVAALAQLRVVLRRSASEHGVRIVKWLGDGAMLCGAELPALALCVTSAIGATAAEGPLMLRAGVCAGSMILFEGEDYVGAPVNKAARLCSAADPGQALVERASLTRGVQTRPAPPVDAPGFACAIAVAELVAW